MNRRFRRAVGGVFAGIVVTVASGVLLSSFERLHVFETQPSQMPMSSDERVYANALLLAVSDLTERLRGTTIQDQEGVVQGSTSYQYADRVSVVTHTVVDDGAMQSWLLKIEFKHSDEYTALPRLFVIKDAVLEVGAPFYVGQIAAELKRVGIFVESEEPITSPSRGLRITVRHKPSGLSGTGEAYEEFFAPPRSPN